MGMVDDLEIEAAVAKALEGSADQRALALLAAAGDPEGCRKRIGELTAAQRVHDVARDAAEKAAADAEAKAADADVKLTVLERREREFLQWKTNTEAQLKKADADARAGEEANAVRAAELVEQDRAINFKMQKHAALIAHMRAHLAAVDAAQEAQ
jgi:hypothetical protein